jgi:uncharacterized protein YjbI with pentapeptide repeats
MSDSDIAGHEADASGHETYGHEQDHAENFGELDQTHIQEHDVHFEHARHISYDDGHGGHYEIDDYTEYSEHDVEVDVTHAAQLDSSDHELEFEDKSFVEHVQEFVSGEWLHQLQGAGSDLHGADLHGNDLHGADLSGGHELYEPERSDSGHATDGFSEVSN